VKTVLLVKDDTAGLIALALILRSEGYVVLESSDGDEAIQVCLEHQGPINLLLMDFELGGSHAGPRLAERLLELSPEMQVLFMFSSPPKELLEAETLPWGCTFLRKSFGPDTLLSAVRESLVESDRPVAGLLTALKREWVQQGEQGPGELLSADSRSNPAPTNAGTGV